MLVRDAANPVSNDDSFPFSRMFDWYHGHSFAKGLFESADSKDEESSSEDAFFAYAIKMWGHVTGDASMEARGNLMLSILSRTLNNYFLMRSDNQNQPANFIPNKVTGIVSDLVFRHEDHGLTDLPSCSRTSVIIRRILVQIKNILRGLCSDVQHHASSFCLTLS